MTNANKLKPTAFNRNWWGLSLIVALTLLLGLSTTGCEKENDNENGSKNNNLTSDDYYVKYEVNSATIYYGGKLDVTLNTEKNESITMTIDQRKLSETVVGPVQKGFNATLKVAAIGKTFGKLELYTKIYVSKNNGPFALKKIDESDQARDSVQLSYTIDY